MKTARFSSSVFSYACVLLLWNVSTIQFCMHNDSIGLSIKPEMNRKEAEMSGKSAAVNLNF